jgi:spermidine/putrescine transport system ATP-binding protein
VAPGEVALEVAGAGAVVATHGEHLAPGARGVLALRPEQVQIGRTLPAEPGANRFGGVVEQFLYRGDVTLYTVALAAGARVQALLPNSGAPAAGFATGTPVEIGWRRDAGHFLTD